MDWHIRPSDITNPMIFRIEHVLLQWRQYIGCSHISINYKMNTLTCNQSSQYFTLRTQPFQPKPAGFSWFGWSVLEQFSNCFQLKQLIIVRPCSIWINYFLGFSVKNRFRLVERIAEYWSTVSTERLEKCSYGKLQPNLTISTKFDADWKRWSVDQDTTLKKKHPKMVGPNRTRH